MSGIDRPSEPIVDAVADARGVDPSELEVVLHDYIHVEALESLAAHENSRWTLTFELSEYEVTVTDGGTVFVDETTR